MSEDEKLYEIEKHARAMLKTWRLWCEWTKSAGREIYMKTNKKRMGRDEFIEEVESWLFDITGVNYDRGRRY